MTLISKLSASSRRPRPWRFDQVLVIPCTSAFVARLNAYAESRGLPVHKVVEEAVDALLGKPFLSPSDPIFHAAL